MVTRLNGLFLHCVFMQKNESAFIPKSNWFICIILLGHHGIILS